jgi:hypothetical protein
MSTDASRTTTAGRRWTRRDALKASLAAGGTALIPGTLGVPSALAQAPPQGQASFEFFPGDQRLNFEVLLTIGAAGYGAAEFGEVSTVIDRIKARGPSANGTYYDAVHAEFGAMGAELLVLGQRKSKHGLRASARMCFLHAAKYLSLPLFFALGTSQPGSEAGDYRIMQSAWNAATKLFDPPFERVGIRWPGPGKLPAYFLSPPGPPKRRPTVILNNGNDAQNVDLYAFGGAAALERGWNALIFEGPGQGSMWFLRGIPFRPDWHRVISPIVKYLRGRDDVARGRIGLIGWSQGGELVAQAAAHDRRLAALVVDPGTVSVVDDFHQLWAQTDLLDLIRAGQRDQANAEWAEIAAGLPASVVFPIEKTIAPFGGATFYDRILNVLPFEIDSATAGRIRAPTLVTQYEGDTAVGPQAQPMFDMLRGDKELVVFDSSQGAQFHDAPMAPQRRNQVVFDWLERKIG